MNKKRKSAAKKRKPMAPAKRRRIVIACITTLVLVSFSLTFAWFTFWRAPEVEEIYDRVVELVEGSQELNTIFYGAGLPTYSEERAAAEFSDRYKSSGCPYGYELLSSSSHYISEPQIRDAAEKIYSRDFLENVVYTQAFVGYAVEDGIGGAVFAPARFLDDGTDLFVSLSGENHLKNGIRIFDYSTMEVVSPSNASKCYVRMDSYLASDPSNRISARLTLVKQDGQWYLDSFAG